MSAALPLFDITESHHGGNQESIEANLIASESKEAVRDRVLRFAKQKGNFGITPDEVAARFHCSHNHVAPRITELKALGELKASDRRRPTRAGATARVLVCPEFLPSTQQ